MDKLRKIANTIDIGHILNSQKQLLEFFKFGTSSRNSDTIQKCLNPIEQYIETEQIEHSYKIRVARIKDQNEYFL